GDGDDMRPNSTEPDRLSAGITLVGKRAFVPWGATIGRNCRIDPGVTEADFHGQRMVARSEEHTSELQSHHDLVCRLLLEKKNTYVSYFTRYVSFRLFVRPYDTHW